MFKKTLSLDNASKKRISKIFFISYSTLEELFNDAIRDSLRWVYRWAKID